MAKSAFGDDLIEESTAPAQGAVSAFGDAFIEEAPQAPQAQPDYRAMANAVAVRHGLNPDIFRAQIEQESSFNPKAVSKAGAQGLGQLMPGTARDLGVTDPFNPEQNLEGSARYMSQLLKRYGGDYDRALSAYNWGMGNVDKFGLKMAPKETRNYLTSIKSKAGRGYAQPETPVVPEDTAATTREAQLGLQYRQNKPAPDTELGREVAAQGRTFGQAFAAPATAAGQITAAVVPDELERKLMPTGQTYQEYVNQKERESATQREQAGVSGFGPMAIAGTLANPITALTGAGQIPRLANLAKTSPKIAAGIDMAARGAAGAVMAPVTLGEGESLLTEKGKQAAGGAVAGTALGAAGRGVINAAGRVAGASKGIMASNDAQRTVDLFKQHGVDYTAGDIDKNRRILRGIEGVLENSRIPGIAINRQPQQIQALEAAKRQLAGEEKRLQSMTFQGLDAVRAAAATEGPRQAEAQVVLKMIDEAGGNAKEIVRASGNLKWLRLKLQNDKLYDEVGRLAGDADVAPTTTMGLVNRYLDKATNPSARPVDYNPETASLLQKWKSGLDLQPDAPGGFDVPPMGTGNQLVDPRGVVLSQATPEPPAIEPNTYMRMRDLHTSISKRIEDASQPGGMAADKTWLHDIKKAVEKDLEAFEDATPGLKAAVGAARSFKRDKVAPFEADELAKALKNSNPDKIWAAFVRQGAEWKGDATQKQLYNALDDKGRAAVRAGIIEDAFQSATTPEAFSPTGFNRMLRQTGYDTFFQGASKRQLDGLMHVMDHINRADPKKLETWTPMLGGIGVGVAAGAGLPGIAAIASGLATTGAAKWLVSSEAGKKLLYSANLYKAGGPKADEAMARVMESFRNQFTGVATRAAGTEAGKE